MSKRTQILGAAISLAPLSIVLLVGLKLDHVIDWPWIWVLTPLWIIAWVALFSLGSAVVDIAFGRR